MDCAIITGADNPVGQIIVRQVINMGFRVFGLGQFKTPPAYEHPQFHPLGCDLTQPGKIAQVAETISREGKVVSVLIHAAPLLPALVEHHGFEDCSPGRVETAMRIQFLGPVLLTRLFLPQLLVSQGHVVFVSPQAPDTIISDAGLAGAVTGLRRFAGQLYDSCRGRGLRVTSLFLHSNKSAKPGQISDRQEHINPRQVSSAIEQALQSGAEGNVITELVLRPQIPDGAAQVQKLGAALDAYREILLPPPENFPTEPKFVTRVAPRSRPTIEPEDLEKVDLAEPVLRDSTESAPRSEPAERSEGSSQQEEGTERRRRRNRGRRGRGRGQAARVPGVGSEPSSDSGRHAGEPPKQAGRDHDGGPTPQKESESGPRAVEKPVETSPRKVSPPKKKAPAKKKRTPAAKKKTEAAGKKAAPAKKKGAAGKKAAPRKRAAKKKSSASD